MAGKLLTCMSLILILFVVLITSDLEDRRGNEENISPCGPSTIVNPVNAITINSCCNKTEDDGQLKEDINEIQRLITNLTSRLEAGEFCCEEGASDVIFPLPPSRELLKDCYDVQQSGETDSGIYTIQPSGSEPFDVYCDMDTDNGGWTVFQRREDGSIDFFRGWHYYRTGFGSVDGEHWLGNDNLYYLSNQKTYQLRVDLTNFEGETRYAEYETFVIADESDNYRLTLGDYTAGDAGDSMAIANGQSFSTYGADHDGYGDVDCADTYKGAWWYLACHKANLNGLYLKGDHTSLADGIEWYTWTGYYYSLKFSEMKLRPVLQEQQT